jgi:membrane protein
VTAVSRDLQARVPVLTVRFKELIERLVAVRVVESSVVLAAQSFLALFPLLIISYAYLPTGAANGLLDSLRRRFGLSGASADAIHNLVGARQSVQQSLSIIGFLVVLGSATAFTRALQRVYERSWGLGKLGGIRGAWRSVVWIVGVVLYLTIVGWLVHLIRNGGVITPLATLIGVAVWWWTPFLLLGGRVRARALVPGAILTAAAQLVLTLVSAVYLPRAVRSSEANYGPIGTVFAIESWFIVVAGVIVVGSIIGAELGSGDNHIAHYVCGSTDRDAWRREVPRRFGRRPPDPHGPAPQDAPADRDAPPPD